MNLALGITVRCSDGAVRELADIVVDGPGRRVTHLVVQPKRQHEEARLVSLELVGEDANGGVSLFCTAETLDGLEREGWVDRADCAADRRVTYAVLTDDGYRKLKEASRTHVADLRNFFEARYSSEELAHLATLLGRLHTDPVETDCSVG